MFVHPVLNCRSEEVAEAALHFCPPSGDQGQSSFLGVVLIRTPAHAPGTACEHRGRAGGAGEGHASAQE